MLIVRTRLDISQIHGIGLFADQFITRDTIIWRFDPIFDIRFRDEDLEDVSVEAREQILKYSYRETSSRLFVLCGDDARFFNHSDAPNCIDISGSHGDITRAQIDIEAGTELTCDYSLFDLDFMEGRYSLPHSSQFSADVSSNSTHP
jgi:SET domain-containing protein